MIAYIDRAVAYGVTPTAARGHASIAGRPTPQIVTREAARAAKAARKAARAARKRGRK